MNKIEELKSSIESVKKAILIVGEKTSVVMRTEIDPLKSELDTQETKLRRLENELKTTCNRCFKFYNDSYELKSGICRKCLSDACHCGKKYDNVKYMKFLYSRGMERVCSLSCNSFGYGEVYLDAQDVKNLVGKIDEVKILLKKFPDSQ